MPAVVAVEEAEEPPASTARAASLVPIAVGLALVAIAGVLLTRGSKAAPSTAASGASASRAASTPLSKANTRHSADESERAAGAPATAADFARRAGESFRANDFATALTAFETAVAGRPDDPDALNNLGQTLVRLNRVPEAIPRFALAVQLAPGKWAYRFNLARARGLVGDWAGAVEDYRIADHLFPDDHATLFNLALALRKAGRPAEALPVLEKVVALAPEDPSFVLTTARTYDELDRRADAAASYRKFLSQSATGPDADAARGRLAALEAPDGQ